MTTPRISAVVISYQAREELRACLSALRPEPLAEIVVVDNASRDGSLDLVRSEFPDVRLIANQRNGGYGAAANQGVLGSAADYVLVLNCDTVLQPGAATVLAAYLEGHPRAAIVGPRLLNEDGTLQPSCFPFLTPPNVLLVMSGLNHVIARVPRIADLHLPTSDHLVEGRVPWVKGAALAIRAAAFKSVGGFDESYFLYGEEHDLCYRLERAGWETHFTPAATVTHIERASSRGREAAVSEQIFLSLIRFYRQHYSRGRLLRLRAVLGLLMSARIARDTLRLSRTRDGHRRQELRRSISVWRRVLLGRVSQAPLLER
jgi:GT2 family glycosyltransferase